ncbi:hypothetical protein BDF21DRAFT_419685 [Thamnidium elegans]|nr:hypothetical protein BDF21DRAFT_419685 [Thamnidium elegans]
MCMPLHNIDVASDWVNGTRCIVQNMNNDESVCETVIGWYNPMYWTNYTGYLSHRLQPYCSISSYVTYISYTQIAVSIYKLISDIFYCSIALIIKLKDCLNS